MWHVEGIGEGRFQQKAGKNRLRQRRVRHRRKGDGWPIRRTRWLFQPSFAGSTRPTPGKARRRS